MRNQLLLLTLFFTVNVCNAQFETGKRVIGGQVRLSFYGDDQGNAFGPGDQRVTGFYSSFSLSRFKSPTLLNGFGFYYSYNHNHNSIGSPANEQTANSHSAGVFINTTKLKPIAKNLYLSFAGTLGGGLTVGKTDYPANTSYSQSTGFGFYVSGGMGLLYQLNQRFLLSCSLSNLLNVSYNNTRYDNHFGTNVNKSYVNSLGIGGGLNEFSVNSLSFGVKYLLKK